MKVTVQQIRKGIRILVRAIKPYRWQFYLILLIDSIKVVLEALVPLLFLPIFYELLGAKDELVKFGYWTDIQTWVGNALGLDSTTLIGLCVLFVVAFAKCVAGVLFVYLTIRMVQRYAYDTRNELFHELIHTRWLYFLNKRVGDSIDTINLQVDKSRLCLTDAVSFFDLIGITLIYTAVAAWISYYTILAAGAAVILAGAIIVPIAAFSRLYGQKNIQVSHDITNYLEEFLGGLKVAKACRMEKNAEALMGHQIELARRYCSMTDLLRLSPIHVLEFIVLFGILCIVILMQRNGLVDLPEAAVTGMLLYRCFNRISTVQMFWVRIFENIPCLNHIVNYQDELTRNRESQTGKTIETFATLETQDLSFHYIPNRPALNELNLTIHRGEMIGIVGGSGAGKTTFVDSILAFLPPTTGRILVNGIDLQELNPHKWRDTIGYVPQEPVMFNESVHYNIALGRTDFSEDDIRWAAEIAHAAEFIHALPEGYKTVIGKRGSKISGGQRQRLALARALIRKPQILILDEVTSSVDAHTEKRMQESLEKIRGSMTILVIAHRLATVMKSDRILVLDRGSLVECGPPAQLLESKGYFSELVALQKLV